MLEFDYELDYKTIDFRLHPELYRIGRGEQGVLLVEPYKSEILPCWRFKTPDLARESAAQIYQLFLNYKADGDFVGMDMARKFLQMGYTRARRYANHKTGRKYAEQPVDQIPVDQTLETSKKPRSQRALLPLAIDPVKAESAQIFYQVWRQAQADPEYQKLRQQHRKRYEVVL
jgi:hypothetical protein